MQGSSKLQTELKPRTINKEEGRSFPEIYGYRKESRERAQDANVVGAGNLNVRNKLIKSLPIQQMTF